MRQFVLGLSVSIAFIVGCVTATVAQSSAVSTAGAAPPAQQWEYQCVNVKATLKGNVEQLNALGAQGWELVATNPSNCLKRPR